MVNMYTDSISRFFKTNRLFSLTLLLGLLPMLVQAQLAVSITPTHVSCFGGSNGAATATASGGSGTYTFLWGGGQATSTITGLTAGSYSVTVTDGSGAIVSKTVAINQPTQLGVTAYQSSQICALTPDGTASAVPFGGTAPYTYLWSNGQTSAQITGLNAGTYTITVTDANSCTAVASATVEFWNEGLWLMISGVNVSCFGNNNGSAHVSPMSGTAPYTYAWAPSGGSGQDATGLSPNTYTVTVTDANGCSNFTSIVISEPAALNATMTFTQAACGSTGTATASVTGGTPNYTVTWSTGQTGATISGLSAGTYSATISDANNCSIVRSVTVSGGAGSLTVSAAVTTQAGCTTGGVATASASGATGTVNYAWSNGDNTATADGLNAGSVYTVTATDMASGCTGTASVTMTGASNPTVSASILANATCTTGGSAQAVASGGIPGYTYLWSTGATTAIANNIPAGITTVTITDAGGCIATASVTMIAPNAPSVTATIVSNATCTGGGSVQASATGGAGGYTYLWSTGAVTAVATNVPVGTASVTVTDASGCSATASVAMTAPSQPTLSATLVSNATCTTGGSATASASGGSGVYTYLWSNGSTSATATNIPAGTATVTVTDASGCTAVASVAIPGASNPVVSISASSNATCDQLGSATVVASGGSGGYTYHWSTGSTTATATNLPAGANAVTVTDAGGCTAVASVNIGQTNNGIKIGDYVWYDNDQDGFQHALETDGVANITVQLIKAGADGVFGNADDVIVKTTTTNSAGNYLIDCVTPGTYILMFNGIPSGYEWTDKNEVPNDCKDSDVNPNGKTDPFTILAGATDNLCFDAGIHQLCDNVMNGGVVCCDQTICEGESPTTFYEVQPPMMGSGAFEYLWMQLVTVGPGPATWHGIPGATNQTYNPGPLYETSHFQRCVRRAGCTTYLESNIITITVLPAGSPGCSPFINNFVVNPTNSNTVSIKWTTNPEFSNYMYSVMYSTDMMHWTDIKEVMGKHNESALNSYEYEHETPAIGKNYYRIKRLDAQNIATFSEIKLVDLNFTKLDAVYVKPTLFSTHLLIGNQMAFDDNVTIQITDATGKLVYSYAIDAGNIVENDKDVNGFAAGMYFATIKFDDGTKRTIKLFKFN